MSNVLIASLGDSPVVVTAMFDRLRQEKEVDQLIVFYTDNEISLISYEDMIYKPLQRKFPECSIDCVALDHDDVSSEAASYEFLRKLHAQLNEHQKSGDSVYLSLAGGRKSMGSLMALLAPLFSCVKGLYHILDEDEETKDDHFWTTWRLSGVATEEQKKRLFPSHERVKLIPIPYETQTISPEVASLLYTITPEQLDELWKLNAESADQVEFYSSLTSANDRGGLLTVELTEDAVKQYRKIIKHDANRSRKFTVCFKQMHYAKRLMAGLRTNKEDGAHGSFFYKPLGLTFHFYKSHQHTTERIVYHTEPQDIAATSAAYIKKVVISELEIEVSGRYRLLDEIVSSPKFSLKSLTNFDSAFPEESGSQKYILIIPLGTSPMVATQLYQLYKDKGHNVSSVILVHTQHKHVRDSVEIACDAFASVGVDCKPVPLKGWEDIDTPKACEAYKKLLEQTIEDTRDHNPSCQIELTISGGRKGMAALATFAAQRAGIRHVVHTVIHKRLSDKVEEETELEELKRLKRTNNKNKRNDRLFLRAYKENRDAFVLFNIPVLPVQKG